MAKEEKKTKNIESVEAKTKTPEKKKSFDAIEDEFQKEAEKQISDFKDSDKEKLETIEKSIGLDDGVGEAVKIDLKVEEILEDLNKKAEKLGKDIKNKKEKEKKIVDKEIVQKVRQIIQAEERINNIDQQKIELGSRMPEMYPGEYDIRKKSLDVEILKARGDINILKEGISDEDLNNLKIKVSNEPASKVIGAETEQEKIINQKKELLIKNIDIVGKAVVSTGYTFEQLQQLADSEKTEDKIIIDNIQKVFDEYDVSNLIDDISKEKPNELLEVINKIDSNYIFLAEYLYDRCINNQEISTQKLINVVFSKMVNKENASKIITDIENRIEKDKQEALKKMPIEDILSSWENETPKERGWVNNYSWRSNDFSLKIAEQIESLRKSANYDEIQKIIERLDKLKEKDDSAFPSFYDCYPPWLDKLNINENDSLKLLTKQLPEDSFRHYFDRYKNVYIPYELLPDSLTEEEKDKYIKSVLLKENISSLEVEEYLKITNKDIFQAMSEDKNVLLNVLKSDDLKLKNLILNSENYSNIIKDGLIKLFESWDYDSIIKLKEKYNLSDESIKLAAEEGFITQLSNNGTYYAIQIKDKFNLSEQFVSLAAEKVFINFIMKDNVYSSYEIKEKFNISEELINSVAEDGIISRLSKGEMSYALSIINNFNIPEKIRTSAAEKGIIIKLSEGDINFVLDIKRSFNISDDFMKSTELIPMAEKGYINQLSFGNLSNLRKVISNFNLSEEFIKSPEAISAAKNGAIVNLQKGEVFLFNTINKDYSIPEEFLKSPEVIRAAKEGLIYILHENSINKAIEIIEKFNITEEFLKSPEVISVAENVFITNLLNGHISNILIIKEKFDFTDEFLRSPEVSSAAKEGLIILLSNSENGIVDDALNIKNILNLSEEIIVSVGEEVIKSSLLNGSFSRALNLKVKLNISDEFYNSHFGELINEIKKQENGEVKAQSLKNIQDSFFVSQNKDKLPEQIKVVLDRFENQYGNKGKNLIALAISAYGIENSESFERKMKNIENVLNRYNPDTIPEGVKTSIGIEYEVTTSIGKIYKENSHLDYVSDIELVSQSSSIGRGGGGPGAIYEFTTKPTYNPYILMAEIKILQDAGFVDLNFEKYQKASRGYHLSLVGDSGLDVGRNMYFLNNMMTMAQLTGITAGEDVSSTKGIHSKSFEHFSNIDQKGSRCEMKGMAADSVEQFEKTIITAHNAGIAIQLSSKYLADNELKENFENAEEFERKLKEQDLLQKPFESNQERDIVYEWAVLKNSAVESVNQHNESFINNEFNGLSLDKNGELIDTTDHIFVVENERRLVNAKITKEELINEIRMNSNDLFSTQSSQFVNALSKTFNFFIFKAIHPDDGQYITIEQPDGTEKKIINLSNVIPIFNMRDEGYKVRDKDSGSNDRKKSIFDFGNEIRDGYYNIGNASEEMIIHKSQILLNRFNKRMEELLSTKGVKRKIEVEEDNLVNA